MILFTYKPFIYCTCIAVFMYSNNIKEYQSNKNLQNWDKRILLKKCILRMPSNDKSLDLQWMYSHKYLMLIFKVNSEDMPKK